MNFESLRGAFDSMRPSYFFLPLFTFHFSLPSFVSFARTFVSLVAPLFSLPSGQKRLLFEKHRNTVKKAVLKIKKHIIDLRKTSMTFT